MKQTHGMQLLPFTCWERVNINLDSRKEADFLGAKDGFYNWPSRTVMKEPADIGNAFENNKKGKYRDPVIQKSWQMLEVTRIRLSHHTVVEAKTSDDEVAYHGYQGNQGPEDHALCFEVKSRASKCSQWDIMKLHTMSTLWTKHASKLHIKWKKWK